MTEEERARAVFETCSRYLLDNGWTRDGDDLGMWCADDFWWSFGDALVRQLGEDGVSMQEEVSA